MNNRAQQIAFMSGALLIACSSLSACGTAKKDKALEEASFTMTTSPDKTTQTTVVKDGEGGTQTWVMKGDPKDGHLQTMDGVVDTGDGEKLKLHGQATPEGGAKMQVEMPDGFKMNATADKDGNSKVEIDGLGGVNMQTDKNGNVSIETPFGKVTAPTGDGK